MSGAETGGGMVDLRVSLGSLTLNNPVFVAAGTYGYGVEFAKTSCLERLGALITKTLTRQPRDGNPPPRLVETPSGMLNAVGLQNMGLERFLVEVLPALRDYHVPVIVSILGDAPEEVGAMVRQLDRVDGAAAIELNLSCPNLQHATHGTRRVQLVAHDADTVSAIIRSARQHTQKPLIAKLSPDVTDLLPVARAAEQAGATALSLGNTFVGMSLDPRTGHSRLGVMTGGLSGPAIRPLAVYRVWYTTESIPLPVIGVGGIVRADDAIEFFLAGASAVAIGTANFADPRTPLRVLRGLERYLTRHHMRSVRDLRGAINQ